MHKYTLMGISAKNNAFPQKIESFKANYSLNTGNLLFNFALELLLDLTGHKFSWATKAAVINRHKATQGIVLPMANNLGKHVDLGVRGPRLEGITKPVIAMGLGGQFSVDKQEIDEVPQGTIRWLNILTNNKERKNISLRGNISASVMDQLGFADCYEVLGCPSLLINESRNLGEKIWNKYQQSSRDEKLHSLVVSAGNPFKREYSKIECDFIELVDRFGSDYIIQHPQTLIQLSLGYDLSEADLDRVQVICDRWFPDKDVNEAKRWFKQKTTTYVSVAQWFLDLSKKEFVVGTRIHGIQAAIQAGVPAVCLYIDSRTKELCEIMNIPCVPAQKYLDGIHLEELFDEFEMWDYQEFDSNRLTMARRTKDFLQSNGVLVTKHIDNLCSPADVPAMQA